MYERRHAGRRLLVALNFGDRPEVLSLDMEGAPLLLSTVREPEPPMGLLRPHEGRVLHWADLSRAGAGNR